MIKLYVATLKGINETYFTKLYLEHVKLFILQYILQTVEYVLQPSHLSQLLYRKIYSFY